MLSIKWNIVFSIHERTSDNLILWEKFSDLSNWQLEEWLTDSEFQYYTSNNKSVNLNKTEDNLDVLEIRQGKISELKYLFSNQSYAESVINGSCNCTFNSRGCTANALLKQIDRKCSLKVIPEVTDYLNPVYSGMIKSKSSFSFTYGRVEINAKIASGNWLSSSCSLYPSNLSSTIWPLSSINIFNIRGNDLNFLVNSQLAGRNAVNSGFSYSSNSSYIINRSNSTYLERGDFNEEFYIFGLVWNPKLIYSYFRKEADPHKKETIISKYDLTSFPHNQFISSNHEFNPFNQKFLFVCSVSIGGNDSRYWGDLRWNKTFPKKDFYMNLTNYTSNWKKEGFLINWIKVWRNDSDLIDQPSPVEDERKSKSFVFLVLGGIIALILILFLGAIFVSTKRNKGYFFATKNTFVVSEALIPSKNVPLLGKKLQSDNNTKNLLLNMNELHLEQILANYSDGVIWKGMYGDEIVAVKSVSLEKIQEKELTKLSYEINLLSKLSHPNIVQFLGVCWDKAFCLCCVFNYVDNGNLRKLLENRQIPLTWKDQKYRITLDILLGIEYFHSKDPVLIHREISSKKILISKDFRAKIGEYSIVRRITKDRKKLKREDPPFWVAPELLRGEKSNEKVDIFSFGVILTELISRRMPYYEYRDANLLHLLQVIADGKIQPSLPSTSSSTLKKIALQCLAFHPEERPTAKELVIQFEEEVSIELQDLKD